ncbi:TIGR03618 family F420-dependent PPOX class oxidoreductase [Nocardioides marmoriginsengisoli]|uniref:TIGR03618 family F420-dependent PPOX class oxidoreductase n=1 Tax=Nocardioides marmoriginsengisoli TaxID=661483 RepID=A0A3N0CFF4_9ACTN|nr:TIGR03618 family F420-dependent PPOX class oxidoreductase [Nocardioides marmoriginsengisoli]RNL62192.1 TIGR03618 family F420-dependent PPOX class oxidoreductase [Nocardioides marmoriginsengisoli]
MILPRTSSFAEFWSERRLCTVTTLRPDGTPHVVPMGVVLDLDADRAWAITSGESRKARNIAATGDVGALIAVCCVDGRHWSTVEGRAVVSADPAVVAEAERRYAERYKVPRVNPARVAVRIEITRLLGNVR